MTRRLAILGSTGSIGTQTLRVLEEFPDEFDVVGLAANRSEEELHKQATRWNPEVVALTESPSREFSCPVFTGDDGPKKILERDVDVLVLSMVGAAGLEPCLEAIDRGVDVALATKEVLVMAGPLINRRLEDSSSRLLPVDSEHNGIRQILKGEEPADVETLFLTASGGPFRDRNRDELTNITPSDATDHPNWDMGPKISIDSATMMNKGLELIEARHLFRLDPDQVQALLHRQSLVHGLVEFNDGSTLAQAGPHDMRLAIQNALFDPVRRDGVVEPIDWSGGLEWTFKPVPEDRYPAFNLARQSMRQGGVAPAVLNAANERTVELFLQENINFLDIPDYIDRALNQVEPVANPNLEQILRADEMARRVVDETVAAPIS